MTARRRWVVTGVSSGLGLAIADAALRRGDEVCGTVRTEADAEAFSAHHPAALAYVVDVRDRIATFRTIDDIARRGKIDVLVNNAGFGLLGAVEELAEEELRSVFDTNFFGAVNVIQAILPHLRAQGSGHILVMSSVSGIASAPGAGAYSATKFALEGL
jgi:NAD(P)-dependent dehydrogenase (short-subunit alcohol dehydrogenase family)